MNEHEIKQLRYQSVLYERLCEAFSSLNDSELSSLTLLEVKLARGKKDADLFIEASEFDKNERNRLISKLQKASGYLSQYVLASEGWFQAPKLHFKMDDTLKKTNRLDEIFEQISKGK